MSQLYIKLNGQSLKDIMVGRNKNIFKTSMQDLKKLDNVNLPFTIEDDLLVNQKLIIDGTMGTLSNKIISANIQEKNTGKVVKNIKLSRKLLSETTVQNIYSMISPDSAIIRLNFYIDGLNIIKDFPFTGAGGGGWEHLYTTYQGHKYVSRDIHSSGLQLLVEVGLLGIILLIWLCMVIIKKYFDLWHHPDFNQTLLWIGAFTILAHSMIDFDFAYFSIQMIFWALLSFLDSPKPFTKLNQAESRIESSILKKNHAVKILLKNMQILSYISFIALIISTIYWPFRCNLATDYAEIYSIEATNNNAITAEQNIRKAIELDPLKAEYKVSLAKLLVLRSEITKASFEEGNLLVAQARVQSDYMYRVLENISDYYQMSSQWDAAFETENRITTIQPLDPLAWQYKGMMIQRAIDWYSTKENVGVKDKQIALWIERGLKIPEEMEIVSKGKWNSVTVNAELQTLLDKWAVFESEQK